MAEAGGPMGHISRMMFVVAALSCGEPKPVVPEPGPGPDDGELAYCEPACARWVELDCAAETVCAVQDPSTQTCTEYITCSEWCRQVIVEAPSGVVFRPKCVAEAVPDTAPSDICTWLDETCGG